MTSGAAVLSTGWPVWPIAGPAADLLWGETGGRTFDAARGNSTQVLGALQRALAEAPAPGRSAREFVELSGALAIEGATFDRVWSDPRAYAWTRTAHALATTGPEDALAEHLDQFKAFALGVAYRSGRDCKLDTPLPAAFPFAIPGTRLSLDGAGPVAISGIVAGRLRVTVGGEEHEVALGAVGEVQANGLILHQCPHARARDYSLPLHPHALHLRGLAVGEPAVRAGLAYHARHAGLVARALALIERHAPDSFEAFRRIIRLIGLKPLAWGGFDDFSPAEMPGAFVASVIENPFVLADHFIHELQHNRLQLIEEGGPLFEAGTGEEARYYSPWRDKPRGLYGIFHGVYVFVGVQQFWAAVHAAPEVGGDDRTFALDRLLRLPVQLELALAVLQGHARLTALGRLILEQLTLDVARIRRAAAGAGLPADCPALTVGEDGVYLPEIGAPGGGPLTVRAALLEHVRRNAAHAQGVERASEWLVH